MSLSFNHSHHLHNDLDSETEVINTTATRVMLLVGFTILVYDHLLTFGREVHGVWRSRWGVVPIIFILNRYIVPVMLIVDIYEQFGLATTNAKLFCDLWTAAQSYLTIASFAGIHALVAMRVFALHGGKPWVGIVLWVSGVTYVLIDLVILTVELVSEIPHPIRAEHGCVGHIPPYLWTMWLPCLIFEGFIFFLTILSAVFQSRAGGSFHPVAFILYSDGILYFVAMSVCSLFSLIVWASAGPTLIGLARYFALALVNVVGSRIVLNLKVYAASLRESEEDSWLEVSPKQRHSHRDQRRRHQRFADTDVERYPSDSTSASATRVTEIQMSLQGWTGPGEPATLWSQDSAKDTFWDPYAQYDYSSGGSSGTPTSSRPLVDPTRLQLPDMTSPRSGSRSGSGSGSDSGSVFIGVGQNTSYLDAQREGRAYAI